MPKRRVPDEQLHGLRIEINERERDLLEQAIYINGASKTLQAVGNAVSGMGLGLGIVGAAIVAVEGVDALTNFFERDRFEWEQKNLGQEKYDAYILIRINRWITAAKKAGRYQPAVGDPVNYSWWRYLDTSTGATMQPLTFEEWELANHPDDPPMGYDAWANTVRAEATRERERKLGYGWLKDITEWFGRQDYRVMK